MARDRLRRQVSLNSKGGFGTDRLGLQSNWRADLGTTTNGLRLQGYSGQRGDDGVGAT